MYYTSCIIHDKETVHFARKCGLEASIVSKAIGLTSHLKDAAQYTVGRGHFSALQTLATDSAAHVNVRLHRRPAVY